MPGPPPHLRVELARMGVTVLAPADAARVVVLLAELGHRFSESGAVWISALRFGERVDVSIYDRSQDENPPPLDEEPFAD